MKANQKHGRHIFITSIGLVFGVCLLVGLFSGPTFAIFSSSDTEQMKLEAGAWWDGSDLVFKPISEAVVESCDAVELQTTILNQSDIAMYHESTYEVYGNDKLLEEATLEPLGAQEKYVAHFQANEAGEYHFKVYQSDMHPESAYTISEMVTVTCPEEADQSNKDIDGEKLDEEKASDSVENKDEDSSVETKDAEQEEKVEEPTEASDTASELDEESADEASDQEDGETDEADQEGH